MLNLSSIIQLRRNDPIDDFRIVRGWKEYTDDRKYMKYLMYELEMMEDNGNICIFIKRLSLHALSVCLKVRSSLKALWTGFGCGTPSKNIQNLLSNINSKGDMQRRSITHLPL